MASPLHSTHNRSVTRYLTGVACATSLAISVASFGIVPAAAATSPSDLAARVVELTNAERQKAGLALLAQNDRLARAAAGYSNVLASGSCFAHTCGPVPDFAKRVASAGYAGYTGLAENIAGGQRTPEAVVDAWMNSAGHRANILNPAYNEIGVGSAAGGQYGIYWTQEFGSRKGVVAPAPPAPKPAAAGAPSAPAAPAAAAPDAPAVVNGSAAPDAPGAPDGVSPAATGDPAADAAADASAAGAADAAPAAPNGLQAPSGPVMSAARGPLSAADLEQMVLELVNQARADYGLPALALDAAMSDVAREHSADMQANGMNHNGSDGSTPRDRLLRAGVKLAWNGENIWSYHNRRTPENGPQSMHDAMMAEPLEPGNWNHIANILMPNFKRVGIGIVISPDGVQYLTEDFAD